MFSSIHQKVLAGFGVVLALLLAAVVLSVHGMSGMSHEATRLSDEDVPAVQALGVLRNGINTMRSTELDALMAPNAKVRAFVVGIHNQARSEAHGALKTYARLARPVATRR